jgi:hypothetical protein
VTINLLRYNGESAPFTHNDLVFLHVLKNAIEVCLHAAHLHRVDPFAARKKIIQNRCYYDSNMTNVPYIYPRHVEIIAIFVVCLYASRQFIHDASVLR